MSSTAVSTNQGISSRREYPATISIAQKDILQLFTGVKRGKLRMIDHCGNLHEFGSEAEGVPTTIRVHNGEFFKRLRKDGSLGLGESYVEGWWDVEESTLVDLFKLLFVNKLEKKAKLSAGTKLRIVLDRIFSNPRFTWAAKRNVAQHYDLGNAFFKQMLGESMTYSCGYIINPEDSITTMQQQKYERILKKLQPQGGKLLDIGCGWGSLLIYAAQKFPEISAVGVTLSLEQLDAARKRIHELGLNERIKIELKDYRELTGQFNRIVSVGMFEHVGQRSYPEFMKQFHNLLTPDGFGLLHTIGSEEDPRIAQDPWVAKYIFPGSILPRLEWISASARKHGLTIGHIENWRPHYALTLARWRENFTQNWMTITTLGPQFDQQFFRLWRYYLELCEACFIDSTVELYQFLLCRRERWSFPLRFEF